MAQADIVVWYARMPLPQGWRTPQVQVLLPEFYGTYTSSPCYFLQKRSRNCPRAPARVINRTPPCGQALGNRLSVVNVRGENFDGRHRVSFQSTRCRGTDDPIPCRGSAGSDHAPFCCREF